MAVVISTYDNIIASTVGTDMDFVKKVQCDQMTDVVNLKIFSPKFFAKIAVFSQNKAKLCKI
jgi:hypothetical protein